MEGLEDSLLPPTFTKLFFKKIFCSSPNVHQGCLGYLAVFTLKISLRALIRAGSAGAIQLLPSQRKVELYDPMPAESRTLGAVGKGQLTFVQWDVTPYHQEQLFFVSFLKLTGFDFVRYKSFPPPERRPRDFASSSKPSPQSFRENFCFSSYAQKCFLLRPVLQNRGSCCTPWGFFRKRHTTIRPTSVASYLLSQFSTNEISLYLDFLHFHGHQGGGIFAEPLLCHDRKA